MSNDQSFMREAAGNLGCAAVAGCLWVLSAMIVGPLIYVGVVWGFDAPDWLSVLQYPDERAERTAWMVRIVPVIIFVASTLFFVAFAFARSASDEKE